MAMAKHLAQDSCTELTLIHEVQGFEVPCVCQYNPRFKYFSTTFLEPFLCFQEAFFEKFCPYVWLVFKSGLKLIAGYDIVHTVLTFVLIK